MLPILTVFIVFLVVLTYHIKKSDAAQAKIDDSFWEKERKANAVRKQDISKLEYLTIPLEKIPYRIHTETEDAFFALAEKPMVNLTGISNTDLKLTYGTANLTPLSEYDANFMEMVILLPEYTAQLLDAGYEDTARMLLEFAVNSKADSSKIYRQLADIYRLHGENDKLDWLRSFCQQLPPFAQLTIQKELG